MSEACSLQMNVTLFLICKIFEDNAMFSCFEPTLLEKI